MSTKINPNTLGVAESLKLGLGTNQHAVNLHTGAHNGAGLKSANLDAATPLVFPPAVIVVTHAPTMWSGMPEKQRMLKSIIETHPKAVSGIDVGYSLEEQSTQIGNDGQEWTVPTQTKRAGVDPSFTFQEIGGMLIWNYFKSWMFDINDPDTNAAFYGMEEAPMYMSSAYSMSICAIQFDPTMRPENIIDAVMITNMYPKDPGGTLGIEKNLATSNIKERSIPFSGHLQHNRTTRDLGIEIARQLGMAKLNYRNPALGNAPAVPNIGNAETEGGIYQEVNKILSTGDAPKDDVTAPKILTPSA